MKLEKHLRPELAVTLIARRRAARFRCLRRFLPFARRDSNAKVRSHGGVADLKQLDLAEESKRMVQLAKTINLGE